MEGRRAPGGPPREKTKPLSLETRAQPNLAALVDIVAWKAARPRLMSCQLGRTRGGVRRGFKRRRPVPPLSPGAPRSPSRTAVRAETAERRHALHPAIGK
eukprot:scaffold115921_cov57-Phaeocystis_antarctica.AAC.1